MSKDYKAKQMVVGTNAGDIHIAGTLDGAIDVGFIIPKNTYTLNVRSVRRLARALLKAVDDVKTNWRKDV